MKGQLIVREEMKISRSEMQDLNVIKFNCLKGPLFKMLVQRELSLVMNIYR